MTNIDEEARSLIAIAAQTITPRSVPPLRLPEPAPRRPSGHRRSIGVRRWLAPAAAGVAVLAIVLAATVVAGRPYARRSAGQHDSTVSERVPAYYIAMTATTSANALNAPQVAGIYSTATGKLVALITPPAPRGSTGSVIGVSAAADDRTFLLTVADQFSRHEEYRFYLARFDPATSHVSLATIPATVPAQAQLDAVALSPDGAKVAYSLDLAAKPDSFELTVLDLRTLRSHTWASSPRLGGTPDFVGLYPDPESLSWANDNTTLAVNWRDPRRRRTARSLLPPASGCSTRPSQVRPAA